MILVVVVFLCLTSLATGTRASFIRNGIRAVVSITAYPFLKVLTGMENAVDYATGLVISYDATRQDLQVARRRLAEMMQHAAQRTELIQENQRLRRMLHFERNEPRLTLEPVHVIESFKGIVMIDRGSLHGIQTSMCAVTENGIVGLVTQADLTAANVVTLYHADCKIGGMIVRNRVRGVVHGSSNELSRYCTLNYIDMKDDVRVGDTVVTSPESIFPTGYPIGRVVAVHETGSLWKSAEIEPAVDPYRLDEVFILRQAAMPLEELAGPMPAEEVLSKAPETPDKRSLQEAYAP